MNLGARLLASALFAGSAIVLVTPYAAFTPGLTLAVCMLIALWQTPVLGVIGLSALVSLEGAFPGQPLLSGAKLVGGATLAVVIIQLLLRRIPIESVRGAIWIPLIAFLAVYIVSYVATLDLEVSSVHARQLAVGLVLFLVTLATRERLNFSALSVAIVLPTAATSVMTLASFSRNVDGRATGLMADPNYFALLLAFALPLAIILAINAPNHRRRALWLGAVALMVAGMVASDSRSGFLVFLIEMVVLLWFYRHRISKFRARDFGWIALSVAVILPLGVAVTPDRYMDRIQSIALLQSGVRSYEDTSLGRRMSYILVGIEALRNDPVIGSGPGTFAGHYARSGYAVAFAGDSDDPDLFRRAHNTYLELFVETGILGGALFVAVILCALRNFWRAGKIASDQRDIEQLRWVVHFGVSYLGLCAFLLFLSVPNHKYLWMSFGLSVIILDRVRRLARGVGP